MLTFQQTALLLSVIWLVPVAVRFRRSIIVLVGGLVAIGLYTLAAFAYGEVTLGDLGLGIPDSWLPTIGLALAWLGLMLACSPLADWLATRWIDKPPTLESFRALQQSRAKLIAGIVVAWVLGGILEELVFRGIVLRSVESGLTAWLGGPIATPVAVCVAALGAGVIHFYQGPRAVIIITQLSILLGVLFVVSGYNLWAVMLCHGLYDTVAFVRFANKTSKYSKLDGDQAIVAPPKNETTD
ncbi:MAG TPA: CPBP family intramembrane glutamic endopeptidase [Gemmataceae bacterium]|nr:CPBP family intramembrane glutamic endopeptidase [Gemmataceae bacterium]